MHISIVHINIAYKYHNYKYNIFLSYILFYSLVLLYLQILRNMQQKTWGICPNVEQHKETNLKY